MSPNKCQPIKQEAPLIQTLNPHPSSRYQYMSIGELDDMQKKIDTVKEAKIEEAYNSYPISRRTCVKSKDPQWLPPNNKSFNYPDQNAINFRLQPRTTASLNPYYNQYEYGCKQDTFGDLSRDPYLGPYSLHASSLETMGLTPNEYLYNNPNGIRNLDVESVLFQKEMARRPRQSGLTQIEFDRFEELPWDPQDVRHIVWEDGLPQGGLSTRNDRLEYQ
jgi:hypothetical protein